MATLETMDGGIADTWNFVSSPVVSVGKGVGHAGMEIGRGASRGDPLRVLTAIPKGLGHIVGEIGRDTGRMAENFYRPSKMRTWMGPTGAMIAPFASFLPPPYNLVAMGASLLLTTGGAAGEKLYQRDRKVPDQAAMKKQLLWLAVAGGVAAVYFSTR